MAPTREGADYQNYSPHPAQPAQLSGAVSVTLLRHVSDVTWGNKDRERKGDTRSLEVKSSRIEIPTYLTFVYMILDPKA